MPVIGYRYMGYVMSATADILRYWVFGVKVKNAQEDQVAQGRPPRRTALSFSDNECWSDEDWSDEDRSDDCLENEPVPKGKVYLHNETLLTIAGEVDTESNITSSMALRSFKFYLGLKVASSFYLDYYDRLKKNKPYELGSLKKNPFSYPVYSFLGAIDSGSITGWAPVYFVHNLFKLPLVPCYAIQTLFEFGFAKAYNNTVTAEGNGWKLLYGSMALVLGVLQLVSRATTSLLQCLLEPVTFVKTVHKHSGNNYFISGLAALAVAAVYVATPIVALHCLPVVATAWVTAKVAVVIKALPLLVSPTVALPSLSLTCVVLRGFYSYLKHRILSHFEDIEALRTTKTRSTSSDSTESDDNRSPLANGA